MRVLFCDPWSPNRGYKTACTIIQPCRFFLRKHYLEEPQQLFVIPLEQNILLTVLLPKPAWGCAPCGLPSTHRGQPEPLPNLQWAPAEAPPQKGLCSACAGIAHSHCAHPPPDTPKHPCAKNPAATVTSWVGMVREEGVGEKQMSLRGGMRGPCPRDRSVPWNLLGMGSVPKSNWKPECCYPGSRTKSLPFSKPETLLTQGSIK